MTSNLGSDEFNDRAARIGFAADEGASTIVEEYDAIKDRVLKQLPDFFSPEFLNRIDKTVVFHPLDRKVLQSIVRLQMDDLCVRLQRIGLTAEYDKKLVDLIVDETYTPEYGARPVRRFIQDKIEDMIASALLSPKKKTEVMISAKKNTVTFEWK